MLNKGQTRALELIHRSISSSNNIVGLLSDPGTGKSYLIKHLLDSLKLPPESVIISSTTHEACSVLNIELAETIYADKAVTVYSALKMKLRSDKAAQYISEGGSLDLSDISIIIVDEVSMMPLEIVDKLLEVIGNYPDLNVLLVGDENQILNVNYGKSKAFEIIPKEYTATLTENMRQLVANSDSSEITKEEIRKNIFKTEVNLALQSKVIRGSGVIETVLDIKQAIYEKYQGKLIFTNAYGISGSVYILPPKRFYKAFKYFVKKDADTRLIAWTNKACRRYNNLARQALYGKEVAESNPFLVGELVIAGNEQIDSDSGDVIARKRAIGKVMAMDWVEFIPEIRRKYGIMISGYRINIQFRKTGHVYIPDEDGYNDYYQFLKELADKAIASKQGLDWGNYWDFKNSVSDLRQSWAITSHGAQGKSMGTQVFVDMIDINKNKNWLERLTLTNVAMSRTTQNVWINQR